MMTWLRTTFCCVLSLLAPLRNIAESLAGKDGRIYFVISNKLVLEEGKYAFLDGALNSGNNLFIVARGFVHA